MKHATRLENGLAKKQEYKIQVTIKPYDSKYCGNDCPQQLDSHFKHFFYCRLFSDIFEKNYALEYDVNGYVKRHAECIKATA